MLQQVLDEIKASQGVLNLNELTQKLGIERSALAGMIQFLVQTGRLLDEEAAGLSPDDVCAGKTCPACAVQPDLGAASKTSIKAYSFHPGKRQK